MKIVPFFPNQSDSLHCLQACIKSVLAFYLPNKKFTDEIIDKKTLQQGGWSWLPPAVYWLNSLGINTKLYSLFDYNRLGEEGEDYLKEFKKAAYQIEKAAGSYENLAEIQEYTGKMITNKLWVNERMDVDRLAKLLLNEETLAIGKTIHEILDGTTISQVEKPTSHYVVIIKEYNYQQWLVHDPGLPAKPSRKISKTSGGQNLFGDIVVLTKKTK